MESRSRLYPDVASPRPARALIRSKTRIEPMTPSGEEATSGWKENATAFFAMAFVVAGRGFEPRTFGLCESDSPWLFRNLNSWIVSESASSPSSVASGPEFEASELLLGALFQVGWLFKDIQESCRAIDSVTLRIAYPFHDIRTFQSVEPAIAGAIIKH